MFYPEINILLDQGRYPEAEAAIREKLGSSMEDPFLFYLLSIALLNQDKAGEAEAAAREALTLDADFDLGYFMLSRCLLARAKRKEALKAIEQAIQLDPEDADYFCQKAQIHLDSSKFDKSLKAAEEGLAVDPEHETLRFFRSITLERLGRRDEADAESEALLASGPDDYQNHCARGWVLAQRGDAAAAERHFIEALRIYPDGGDARAGLAFAFRMKNPVLGSIMRVLIWMERIPWWVLLVGVILTLNYADKLAASEMPPPIPQIGMAVRLAFWAFFLIVLLINPLVNLILLTSKTARHALTNDERRAVKWFVLPLVISLTFLALWCLKGGDATFPIHAVTWAAVARFIYETYEATAPSVRRKLAVISVVVFLAAVWVEVFTYGYLIPRTIFMMENYSEAMWAASVEGEELGDRDRENRLLFLDGMRSLIQMKIRYVNYVALAMWLAACFSDDIADFLRRRSPD